MGQCKGLTWFSASTSTPTPSLCRHDLIGDDSLVGVDGDVLDGDLLLPPPAPCIRHTRQPLTAGARHGCPLRFERAIHRGA